MVDLESPVTEGGVQQETPRFRAELHLRLGFLATPALIARSCAAGSMYYSTCILWTTYVGL